MTNKNISARVELNKYTNKVLTMLKAKYDLKDKSEAINKFADIYGEEIIEKEATEEYAKKVIETVNRHLEKSKNKKMSVAELDKLCEI